MAKGMPEGAGPIKPFDATWNINDDFLSIHFDDHGMGQVTYEWFDAFLKAVGFTAAPENESE